MKILALDFSSPQRSVAVANGSRAVAEFVETGSQGMQAFRMIEDALLQAELEREQVECIVVGLGPGSYTGIRAALSIAQGWQLARGIKLLGISSVAAIAHEAQAEKIHGKVNIIVDAQRNELYLATYQISSKECVETKPLHIVPHSEIANKTSETEICVGPEVTRWFPTGKTLFPRAAMLARLAQTRTDFTAGEKLEPIYLRETAFVKAPPSRIIS